MSSARTSSQWKFGLDRLDKVQDELEKLKRVVYLIKMAEDKHEGLIIYAQGPAGEAFPSERAEAFREAAITMAAHARLVQYFNNLVNEIQL
jgi:hypothetical protein